MLQKEPLEVKDFSGGLTDHNKLGDPKRYIFADNLLVNNDKRLVSRHGSTFYDTAGNHVLPGTVPSRVSKFLSYDNKKEILINRGESIYYMDSTPSWTLLTGPSGNQAVQGGEPNHSLSWSEWRKHVYFTSDNGGKPSFMYKDDTGSFRVRTAGMPMVDATPTHTESTLLQECITLANALRVAMLAHIADTNLHLVEDKWSKGYFTAVSWSSSDAEYPGPIPAVSPHGAATTEATLYTLVEALSLAYEHHGFDLQDMNYHLVLKDLVDGSLQVPPKGPFKLLTNNTAPSTGTTAEKLTTAATQLDEIYQRWFWHRFGLQAHKDTTKDTTLDFYADVDYHPVLAAKIGVVDLVGVPKITPNFDDFYNYVNYLKRMYNLHVQSNHTQETLGTGVQRNYVGLPDCDDLDLAYLIIYWVRMKYGWTHFKDANVKAHVNFTCDTTAGSADVTDVKDPDGGALTLPVGEFVAIEDQVDFFADGSQGAEILASGSGTATFSKVSDQTEGDAPHQHSSSIYHVSRDESTLANNKSLSPGSFLNLEDFTLPADEKISPEPQASLLGENQNLPSTVGGWLDKAQQAFQAIYLHAYNFNAHQTNDDPHLFLSGLGYNFYKPNIVTYGYAAHYKHTYKNSDGLEFEQSGPPIFIGPIETCVAEPEGKQMETGIDTSFLETHFTEEGKFTYLELISHQLFPYTETSVIKTTPVEISMLPQLVNDNQSNYTTEGDSTVDGDYTTIDLFRTSHTGTTYFKLGEVPNGTSTYSDQVHDTETNGKEGPLTSGRTVLYTTGGLVPFDQAPECKYMHIVNNVGYYGHIIDTGQTFSTRILQSVPDRPYAVPATFSDDLEDEVMGITSSRSIVIAFGKKSIYRILGSINNIGQGKLEHDNIGEKVGLVSSDSIVQTEIGVFFAGTDGFYYTDGFKLIKISIDLDKSYAKLIQNDVQRSRIHGAYDALTRVIWWGVQSDPFGTDCDETWQFHLNYGVKPAGVFTKSKNGRHFNPSALTFLEDGEMLRGHSMGYIFKHNKWLRSDPSVPDVIGGTSYSLAIGSWPTVHLPWRYQSCALDFGSIAIGQWVTKFHLLGDNVGNAGIQITGISDGLDDSRNRKRMGLIRYDKNIIWGNPKIEWGDTAIQWKGGGKLDAKRRFSGNMRSQLKAVEMVPAYIGVYRYDDYHEGAYATLTGTAAVLSAGFTTDSSAVWPLDVVGMFLTVDYDDYVIEYAITAVSGDTITFADVAGDSVDGIYKWVIRGYSKTAGFSPLGYVMHFAQLGERGDASTGPTGEGENA